MQLVFVPESTIILGGEWINHNMECEILYRGKR